MGGNVFVPDGPGTKGLTGIAIDAKVWNTGGPSVATDWALFVIPKGVAPVVGQLTKMPDTLRLAGPINSSVITAAESLDAKTASTPVGNIPVAGRLLFYVPLSRDIVLAPTTQLRVDVFDIYKKGTTTSKLMGEWLRR